MTKPPQKTSDTANKAELQKAKKAMPPEVVGGMIDDIAKIDPRKAGKTGTLGKVGHLTAHAVDPTTLGIHHGITKGLDISKGATSHHTSLVPKGHLYVSHEHDPQQLPADLLGRAVEDYLVNHGWKADAAARIAKHLTTPPQGAQPRTEQVPPPAAVQQPGGIQGLPPWAMGGGMPGQGMPGQGGQ